jgi:hypothetical protein
MLVYAILTADPSEPVAALQNISAAKPKAFFYEALPTRPLTLHSPF